MLRLFEAKGYGAQPESYSDMVYWAARHGETAAVSHYLGKGGDPNRSYRDSFALDVAAYYGDLPTVEALLKAGARTNVISEGEVQPKDWAPFKRTPLITATLADERAVVERLLKAGADAKEVDGAAAVWADLVGDDEVFRMLKNAGAKEPTPFAFAEWLGRELAAARNEDRDCHRGRKPGRCGGVDERARGTIARRRGAGACGDSPHRRRAQARGTVDTPGRRGRGGPVARGGCAGAFEVAPV
jgi:hypothetical protein